MWPCRRRFRGGAELAGQDAAREAEGGNGDRDAFLRWLIGVADVFVDAVSRREMRLYLDAAAKARSGPPLSERTGRQCSLRRPQQAPVEPVIQTASLVEDHVEIHLR